MAAKNYDLKKAQDEVNKSTQEAARFQQELHDKLSATLTDIAFKAGSPRRRPCSASPSPSPRPRSSGRSPGRSPTPSSAPEAARALLDGLLAGAGSACGGFFADWGRRRPSACPYHSWRTRPRDPRRPRHRGQRSSPITSWAAAPVSSSTRPSRSTPARPSRPWRLSSSLNLVPNIKAETKSRRCSASHAAAVAPPRKHHGAAGTDAARPCPAAPGFVACRFGLETNTQSFVPARSPGPCSASPSADRPLGLPPYSLPAHAAGESRGHGRHVLRPASRGRPARSTGTTPTTSSRVGQAKGSPQVNGGSARSAPRSVIDGCTAEHDVPPRRRLLLSVNGEYKRLTADAPVERLRATRRCTSSPRLRNSPADNAPITVVDRPTVRDGAGGRPAGRCGSATWWGSTSRRLLARSRCSRNGASGVGCEPDGQRRIIRDFAPKILLTFTLNPEQRDA